MTNLVFMLKVKDGHYKAMIGFLKFVINMPLFFSKNNFKPVYFQRRVREGDFSLDYDYNFDFN